MEAELAKALSSDGLGPHEHGKFGLHSHGEPSFDDDFVAYLEQKGMHVDRHHGVVYSHYGSPIPPATVAAFQNHFKDKVRYEQKLTKSAAKWGWVGWQ